jgi:hypothetical protein
MEVSNNPILSQCVVSCMGQCKERRWRSLHDLTQVFVWFIGCHLESFTTETVGDEETLLWHICCFTR